MSLLKDIIEEMAATGSTGANSIAGSRGSLFGGGVIDLKRARRRQARMMRRIMGYTVVSEGLNVNNSETQFDGSDAISKIDAAEKKAKANDDTVTFGLEDEDGGLVKVYVKSDQADDFEQTLAAMLSGEDDNEDDENSAMEIAEVLFKLKDKFEIVDVEWPTIEGDEEEEQEVEDELDTGDESGNTGDTEDETSDGIDTGDQESDNEQDMTADEDAKSALQSVIDVMKADAEAKEAEAKAKEAEAKAKEAEYVAQASAAKVKQEEEVLDMEAYYKEKSEKEKETKQLAKLAKYKHDTASEAETSLSLESEEEEKDDDDPWITNTDADLEDDKELTTKELASLILKNLKAN